MPNGYSTKKVLYLNQEINPGWNPLSVNVKYEYRTTSVTLHATSILEYPALLARKGKLLTMPQTRRRRLATCIAVVLIGALTRPFSNPKSALESLSSMLRVWEWTYL